MIYPKSFEHKIEFDKIRSMLETNCLSPLGKSTVMQMTMITRAGEINEKLEQIRQLKHLQEQFADFAIGSFHDARSSLKRIRMEGTFMETDELWELKQTLVTTVELVKWFRLVQPDSPLQNKESITKKDIPTEEESTSISSLPATSISNELPLFPALHALTEGVITFPSIIQQVDQIVDKFGNIKDSASPELQKIRRELTRVRGSISGILNNILSSAHKEGYIDKDVTPTMRDGRLVIPVAPGMKRKLQGIIHDESDSGKTVYIEPSEVVEANNRIRELQSDERHEIINILKGITKHIRPHVMEILYGIQFLGQVDFIQAKVKLAKSFAAVEPEVLNMPAIDWVQARHPLLQIKLKKEHPILPHSFLNQVDSSTPPASQKPFTNDRFNKEDTGIVPLDIVLTLDQRILVISGPNAGGKSVCLKTVGLLQYMLQCGLSIPVAEHSKCGVFKKIMIDIGDEQSIDDDLSTYSSHLMNMKNMIRQADNFSLILIDEFGTGTEPQIGGAIAESVLEQFCKHQSWAVITTHYKNLKDFASAHPGIANGAMLYDRQEMRPLFQLSIGNPGSSFAIDIARKIGLPEEVINHATKLVGENYIQSDKFLQDIIRDKRYWESKRQAVHRQEKDLQEKISYYETEIQRLKEDREKIIRKAKTDAEDLLRQSNKRIENAIREIRESQAEKEATRKIREDLEQFQADINEDTWGKGQGKKDEVMAEFEFQKKIEQIQRRKERHEKRKLEKEKEKQKAALNLKINAEKAAKQANDALTIGEKVRIKGLASIGLIDSIEGNMCTVIFGDMRTKLRLSRLERANQPESAQSATIDSGARKSKADELKENLQAYKVSHITQSTIDQRRQNFHQDLDVRGMRGDEALNAVQYFIDDAILMGVSRVRILHGKGNGILRQLIRQYLGSVPNVSHFKDEHVQFGGAGITVADID